MTTSYTTSPSSSGSSSLNMPIQHHNQAHTQYSPVSSPQSHQPEGYGLDPIQQYARIIYEHTRRQLDSASSSSAATQQSHRDATQAHRSHHAMGKRSAVSV